MDSPSILLLFLFLLLFFSLLARVQGGQQKARAGGRPCGHGWVVETELCGLFGFGEVGLDVFRLDVVEIAGAGVDGEADEAADEDVAPDPAGDGMGEGKWIYDVQFTIYNLKSSCVRCDRDSKKPPRR